MERGVDAKRCGCNVILDNLMNGLAERTRRRRYLSNVSTVEKFLNLQLPVPTQEIADCDCDAGLAIKKIKEMLGIENGKSAAKSKRKNFNIFIFTFPIKMKIEQKIKSIFPNRHHR